MQVSLFLADDNIDLPLMSYEYSVLLVLNICQLIHDIDVSPLWTAGYKRQTADAFYV